MHLGALDAYEVLFLLESVPFYPDGIPLFTWVLLIHSNAMRRELDKGSGERRRLHFAHRPMGLQQVPRP
jgi:hypothetical protein